MKKRFLILITTIVLCVLIPSAYVHAALPTAGNTTPLGMIESAPEGVASPDATSAPEYAVYRAFLNENSAVVGALYEGISAAQTRIDISQYHISVDDMPILMNVMLLSFPELFYLNGYRYQYSYNGTVTAVEPYYSVTDPEEKKRLFLEAAASRYLPLITDDMDDFTKAVILHDELALNVRYERALSSSSNNYTCLAEGWGVCQQYSECYAYLLAQCGIKSEIIQSEQMAHAWLKILLDGHYYNVDVTWDDPIPDKSGKVSHSYFLFSDSVFQTEDAAAGRSRHYDYSSIHPADSAKYDCFENLHSIKTQLCYLNGSFYAITHDGKLVRYDHHTDQITVLRTLDFTWPAGVNRFWVGNFSSLVSFSELLYYNSPNEIYQYDPETNTSELFAENTGDDPLYGLRVIDHQLYVIRTDSPNNGNIEPDYISDLPIPTYDITIDDAITGGIVTADKKSAAEGEIVTLTVTPDNNADLVAVTVNRTRIELTDGVYSFTMPASDVTVSAEFERNTEWRCGDVDRDGEITIIDATAIQRVLVNLPTSVYDAEAADFDGDGEVSILDATAIQRWLVNLPSNNRFTDA